MPNQILLKTAPFFVQLPGQPLRKTFTELLDLLQRNYSKCVLSYQMSQTLLYLFITMSATDPMSVIVAVRKFNFPLIFVPLHCLPPSTLGLGEKCKMH